MHRTCLALLFLSALPLLTGCPPVSVNKGVEPVEDMPFEEYTPLYDIQPAGVAATGMGGVHSAVTWGLEAAANNPAGMTGMPSFGLTGGHANHEMTSSGDFLAENESLRFDASGVFGFGWPIRANRDDERPAAALAYVYHPVFAAMQGEEIFRSTGVHKFAIAKRISPWLTTGVSLNLWRSKTEMRFQDTLYFDGTPPIRLNWASTAKDRGTNGTFGLQADLRELAEPVPVRLGLVVQTPYAVDPESILLAERQGEMVPFEAPEGFVEMPWMMTAGAAWEVTDHLTLAFDYDGHYWKGRNWEVLIGEQVRFDRSLHNLHAGVEYRIPFEAAGGKALVVRAGAQRLPSLIDDLDGEPVVGYGASAGLGLHFEWMTLDVAWTETRWERTLADTEMSFRSLNSNDYRVITQLSLYTGPMFNTAREQGELQQKRLAEIERERLEKSGGEDD